VSAQGAREGLEISQISGGLEDQESYWAFVSFVAAKGQILVI
jgi:hypothetical protein